MKILKVINYDKFKCSADKCKFTCCSGWDVNIDDKTYEKWKNDDSAKYIVNNIILKEADDEKGYCVDKETAAHCPFLDVKGLCEIVKSHGEDYLSNTCHTFPRIENIFDDVKEISLSCACPQVVEIIAKSNRPIEFEESIEESENIILKIRETLIKIISFDNIDLEYKMLIAQEMLIKLLDTEDLTYEFVLKVLEQYNEATYARDIVSDYKATNFDILESITEFNSFFIDITENYKEVLVLKDVLNPLVKFAGEVDLDDLANNWSDFKKLYLKEEVLLQNCIISKIISSCTSDDVEEITNAMQMIILDYLLTRYASFLKYSMSENKEINISDIQDYIVVFSRVIGNNIDAVADFLEESFDDYILELGYLSFISLF